MPGNGWKVPYGADQTVYLVVDRIEDRQGELCCEFEVERTDPETIIADLLAGQFNDPVRVIAFNTLEHWSQDVSRDIAAEIQTRCDIEGAAVPEHVEDFVNSHTRPAREHPWGRRPEQRRDDTIQLGAAVRPATATACRPLSWRSRFPAKTATSPSTRLAVMGSPTSWVASNAAATGLTVMVFATRVGVARSSASTHRMKASAPPPTPR